MWICFATGSRAKIIDMNLSPKGNYVGPTKQGTISLLRLYVAVNRLYVTSEM
jgi:hypothetical protein